MNDNLEGGGGGDGDGGGGKKKVGGSNTNDKLRGGKQKDRDRSMYRYPKPFRQWYHREIKPDVHPDRDATPEELREAFKEWSDLQTKVTTVSVWAMIGIGIYETAKWGVAVVLAPETGGVSLAAAAASP